MNKSLLPVPSGIFKILDLSGNDNNNKENSLELRLATREKHINYLKGIGDKVILAGPILDKKDLP